VSERVLISRRYTAYQATSYLFTVPNADKRLSWHALKC
jgi:hypothetical protein